MHGYQVPSLSIIDDIRAVAIDNHIDIGPDLSVCVLLQIIRSLTFPGGSTGYESVPTANSEIQRSYLM